MPSLIFCLFLIASVVLIGPCDSFRAAPAFLGKVHSSSSSSSSSSSPNILPLSSSTSPDNNNEPTAQQEQEQQPVKRDLVSQELFIRSVESLRREMFGSNSSSSIDENNKNMTYVLARTVVQLPIDTTPGLELGESESLVLVIGVSQETYDQTGIKPLDTIVSVKGAEGFEKSTKELSIEDTAQILQEAVEHTLQRGEKSIELELNRLMKGFYKDD